jgi:glyoxylase-like metal-dependent hydrolase (beta-lactamase superfamily II)
MPNLSRRDFFATSSAALGTVAYAFAQNAPAPAAGAKPPQTTFDVLRGGVYVFGGRGGTIGMLVASDGVVVVDTQFPDTAPIAVERLREISARKIDLLINSHHHGDHTSGNSVFRPSAIKHVAHRRVPELLKTAKSETPPVLPETTFDTTWSERVGSETVSLKHYGPAHTGGDAVITFQNANVVHLGDLMSFVRHPRLDRPAGGSLKGWIATMEAVVKDHPNDTMYISGHSKVNFPTTVTRADLLKFRDYLSAVADFTQKAVASGRPAAEVVKTASLPGFADYEGSPEFVLQAAFDELSAKG